MSLINKPWRDFIAGFILGALFWQYKHKLYCKVYDWWEGKRESQ